MADYKRIDVNALHDFLIEAKVGDAIVYFTGASLSGAIELDRDIYAVRDLAYRAMETGKLALTQRRLGPGRFAYVATRIDAKGKDRSRQKYARELVLG